MDSPVVLVKMAEISVIEDSKLLKTTLGSCVGVILHDPQHRRSGLAHIMLPEQVRQDPSIGKYADTAIPALVEELVRRGSRKEHLRAYIAGGANMFQHATDRKIATVGEKNIAAVRRLLEAAGVPIEFEDTGGERGRTLEFNNRTAEIKVRNIDTIKCRGSAI